jgi:glycosyltransferase involved in cell wall biosynthesis
MSPLAADIGFALLPFVIAVVVVGWRARGSRHLDAESDQLPVPTPRVSVVIPARDEARNIERCLLSVLTSTYPALDIVVVDDHSTDRTGDIARRAAAGDPRVRVAVPGPLPQGWFGKSWACAFGATETRGELLLFLDADTSIAPDLVVRLVNAMRSRRADLISIGGRQELGSFWERVVQPQVFALLLARFGSTERMSGSRRAMDKIANGQCILVRRDAYEAVGGHAAVRDKVAEDLMLAQTIFRAGKRVSLVVGIPQLSTRMYTSLGELVRGWGKNIYAGAVDALPLGWVGRFVVIPILLLAPAIFVLIPPTALALALGGVLAHSAIPAAVATLFLVVVWSAVYRAFDLSPAYGVLYPLGSLVLLYIVVTAIWRGRRVAWKGRSYTAW